MDIVNNVQFNIDCCVACGEIIMSRITHNDCKQEAISRLKEKYKLETTNEELFELAKDIFVNNLANDKYGVNVLKEARYV